MISINEGQFTNDEFYDFLKWAVNSKGYSFEQGGNELHVFKEVDIHSAQIKVLHVVKYEHVGHFYDNKIYSTVRVSSLNKKDPSLSHRLRDWRLLDSYSKIVKKYFDTTHFDISSPVWIETRPNSQIPQKQILQAIGVEVIKIMPQFIKDIRTTVKPPRPKGRM